MMSYPVSFVTSLTKSAYMFCIQTDYRTVTEQCQTDCVTVYPFEIDKTQNHKNLKKIVTFNVRSLKT